MLSAMIIATMLDDAHRQLELVAGDEVGIV
jgi:hypothetical protein